METDLGVSRARVFSPIENVLRRNVNMLMSFENKVGKIREIYIPRLTKKGGKEIDTPRCFHCGWLITRAEPRLLVVVTTTTCFTNRVKKFCDVTKKNIFTIHILKCMHNL